jgi:hypothetical protein
LGTDTTGCGTCQNSIQSIAKHNHFTSHIGIDTYNVSGSGKYLYHYKLQVCVSLSTAKYIDSAICTRKGIIVCQKILLGYKMNVFAKILLKQS